MGNGNQSAGYYRLTLPEEQLPTYARHPHQYRWFKSPNVSDLWKRRSADDRMRIAERLKRQGVRW